MDQELIAFLTERFRETSQQIESLREETAQQFAGVREQFVGVDQRFARVEDEIHQTRIVVEGLRDQVRLVAEGVMSVSERLEFFRSDVAKGFDDVKASFVPYYEDLNRRVGILQGRADRETRDIIDVIREKFGRPQQ
jgi:predicted  nucleic acid-binding Zn-ribbon protein